MPKNDFMVYRQNQLLSKLQSGRLVYCILSMHVPKRLGRIDISKLLFACLPAKTACLGSPCTRSIMYSTIRTLADTNSKLCTVLIIH
jgi:hypothetical protein